MKFIPSQTLLRSPFENDVIPLINDDVFRKKKQDERGSIYIE